MAIKPLIAAGAALAALVSNPAWAVSTIITPAGVSTWVSANYQDTVAGPTAQNAGAPGSVNPSVSAGPGLGDMFGVMDEALAEARSNLPGTIGTYAQACCYSPAFPPPAVESVAAYARATQVTHWEVQTANAGITSADIDVFAFLDGFLRTMDYAGAGLGDVFSSVTFTMGFDIGSGVQNVFTGMATLDDVGGLSASGPGTWATSFSAINLGDNDKTSTVNYSEFFGALFNVPTNTVFAWVVELESEASIVGPYEMGAVSDFLNTGDFTLSTGATGVDLVDVTPTNAVPVPASGVAMAAGLCLAGIVAYRRRQA